MDCPFCTKTLSRPLGFIGMSDAGSPITVCKHCHREIQLRQLPTPDGAPLQFILSEKQAEK